MYNINNMFRVSKLTSDAVIPQRANIGDAGYDLVASEDIVIGPNERSLVSTGISIEIPNDCYARVAPRSGLAVKKGIQVGAGVVDSSYRGEVKVLLFNHGNNIFEIKKGDRIAQMIFEKIYTPSQLVEVPYEELSNSSRGDGGFGSTGVSSS